MILVTGATGNVGGEVIRELVRRNQRVRALVRKTDRSIANFAVEVVAGDLDESSSLSEVMRGVRGVFLLGGFKDMPSILDQIRKAGVEHVVLLTSRSAIGGNPRNAIVDMWLKSETAVRSSRVPFTILRPSGFMSNALRWASQLRTGDVVRVPFAKTPIAAIDPFDIAGVATAALTEDGHTGEEYALTGPEALYPAEQVATLADVLRRPLRLEEQSDDAARAAMLATMPATFVDGFFRFFSDGEFDDSSVLPTVKTITGRSPRTFRQWTEAHATAFTSV